MKTFASYLSTCSEKKRPMSLLPRGSLIRFQHSFPYRKYGVKSCNRRQRVLTKHPTRILTTRSFSIMTERHPVQHSTNFSAYPIRSVIVGPTRILLASMTNTFEMSRKRAGAKRILITCEKR